jgi:hypothetical protein
MRSEEIGVPKEFQREDPNPPRGRRAKREALAKQQSTESTESSTAA